MHQWGPAYTSSPEVYLPQPQFARNERAYEEGAMLVVKSRLPPGRVEAALRAAAAPLDSQLLLGPTQPLDHYLGWHFQQRRCNLGLAVAFAPATLATAAPAV